MKAQDDQSVNRTENRLSFGLILPCLLFLLFSVVSEGRAQLPMKAHIPWGTIRDFEFFEDGIFISVYDGGIGYFSIDEDFNLAHQYTIDPGGYHLLSQFCLADSFLFALDGATLHAAGTPVLFDYEVSGTAFEYLGGIESSIPVWEQFAPIVYHDGSVIYYNYYSGTYYRVDVSQPDAPFVTGSLPDTHDVSKDIMVYQDTLLISARQRGSGHWDGNFRIIRNVPPDPLTSIGAYGMNAYSYTSFLALIDDILFTSHLDGLRVFDISNLEDVQQIYFYSTEWGRCVAEVNNYIFMGCNNGWHFFEYTEYGEVEHLEFFSYTNRVLRMRMKLEEAELWCFVDGGALGGLVVLDISEYTGIEESESGPAAERVSIQNFPNPFTDETTISYSIPADGYTTLRIYNLAGQLVKNLQDHCSQPLQSGSYTVNWDGTNDSNRTMPGGVYLCHIVSANSAAVCKLILVK